MTNHPVVIIAEAGVNHNGSLSAACLMAEKAAQAGADFVKFQTFHAQKLVTKTSATAEYQQRNCNATSQLDMLRRLELSEEDFRHLAQHCKKHGIRFLSTPFDLESVDFLVSIGVDIMKVPSGEITNLPLLRKIGQTRLPVILSTGMSDLAEISHAIQILTAAGTQYNTITLLHCNTEYPTPYSDVNLRAMKTLEKAFSLPVGYSDHTPGTEVPIGAVALGATVIEKHFTLNKNDAGPDHAASLDPNELHEMVVSIRNIEKALGSPIKEPSQSEKKNINVARRSIVATTTIRKGEIFTEANLTCKRPGGNLSPMLWDTIIGLKASKDFEPDEPISL